MRLRFSVDSRAFTAWGLAVCVGAAMPIGACTPPLGAQATTAPDSVFIREHYRKRVARIPMRDGIRLFTTVYVPKDASSARRYPIVLTRTPFSVAPYDPAAMPRTLGPDPFMLRDGYVFVQQEVRGRYLSEGTFENVRPLLPDSVKARDARAADEATDASDTIDWLLAHVEGNDGRVGLFGVSYGGYYAGLAATSRHPAIAALSLQGPVADFFFEDFHHNGALTLANAHASAVFGTPRPAPTASHWWLPAFQRAAALTTDDYFNLLGVGPLRALTERWLSDDLWWREIVRHPSYDAFWRARALPPRLAGISTPTLVVGGWLDAENLWGTLASYRALRERSPAADVALVVGPFGHRGWGARDAEHAVHGNLYFGDSLATRFQRDVEAVFFRAHLKGDTHGVPRGALVFDTGRSSWRRFDRWPGAEASRRAFHLRADGTLTTRAPTEPGAFREYTSDPRKPVPARCAGPTIEDGTLYHYMSDDQRCFASRPDVLVFQTDTLREDVTFAGELEAALTFSTSGTDADVVVKLVDVHPPDESDHPFQRDTTVRMAGYQQLVRGEIMRGRFRRSFAVPEPFQPGARTEVTVRLPDVFHTFRKGHRIMLQVQSSWFPLFDRNPQRYVPSIYDASAGDFVAARQRVWVGRDAGSRLTAAVLP